ncbi:MAG: type III-B CRISPR module RAMP protein Cmr4, partial [Flavobacteriales bacterium]|nr:type III-B CRISPR module RAMP protein Cmr4 [Flavobacteriales bacterium]
QPRTGIGIIDRMVQRDPATGLPCVHTSSLKGAIKQHADLHGLDADTQKLLFGSDAGVNKAGGGGDTRQGQLAVLPAKLLFHPAQGEKQPYFLVSCPSVLNEWARELELLGARDELPGHIRRVAGAEPGSMTGLVAGDTGRDGGTVQTKNCPDAVKLSFDAVAELLGEGFAVFTDAEFIELTDDFNLPVVARNSLDDGQSQNLWYEQLVPRCSVFWTALLPLRQNLKGVDELTGTVTGKLCQVGANASVGMGQVEFKSF